MDPSFCSTSASKSEEIPLETCHLCCKKFKNVEFRNRHIRRTHKINVLNPKIARTHIICPLCEEETDLKSHEGLRKHFEGNHQVSIELITFEFSSKQEYDTWKDEEKIETNYAMHRSIRKKEHRILYFDCNRSDHRGYKPNYNKRTEKFGGTIKIKGMCPSRLICKLRDEGQVSVSYWKTHAGHELRSKHFSKAEKLQSGVPEPNRILDDSRKLAQSTRSLQWENLQKFVEDLDDNNFTEFMKGIQGTVCKLQEKTNKTTHKRKMEKRENFPSNKRPKL